VPRYDESVQVVEDRSREELTEETRIALIGSSKCTEVLTALTLVDDRRWISEPLSSG